MTLRALKALPHGIAAGVVFEETTVVGRILIAAGAAEEVVPTLLKPRGIYKRRDLRAE